MNLPINNDGIFSEQDWLYLYEEDSKFTLKSDDINTHFLREAHPSLSPLLESMKIAISYQSKYQPLFKIEKYKGIKNTENYSYELSQWASKLGLDQALLTILTLPFPDQYELGIELQTIKKCLDSLSDIERTQMITALRVRHADEKSVHKFVDAVHKFLQKIHEQLNHRDVKVKLLNRKTNFQKVKNNCHHLINRLFSNHSKLLVIRIDFAFKRTEHHLVPRIDPDLVIMPKDNLFLLKRCIKQLLNNRRHNQYLSEILGYVLRYEYGLDKGFHVHAFFFLDGNKHREDITWAQYFSEYWKTVTQGKGCTYICNMEKEKYRYCGIGLIHFAEKEKRQHLNLAIDYICKTDQYFWYSNLSGARAFQISQPPKNRQSKVGRPRLNSYQKSNVMGNHA